MLIERHLLERHLCDALYNRVIELILWKGMVQLIKGFGEWKTFFFNITVIVVILMLFGVRYVAAVAELCFVDLLL